MIEETQASTLTGAALDVARIRESGKLRVLELRTKLATEERGRPTV
jgi:hypothetical protein